MTIKGRTQAYAAGNKVYGFGRSNPTSGPVDPLGYRERDLQKMVVTKAVQSALAKKAVAPAAAPKPAAAPAAKPAFSVGVAPTTPVTATPHPGANPYYKPGMTITQAAAAASAAGNNNYQTAVAPTPAATPNAQGQYTKPVNAPSEAVAKPLTPVQQAAAPTIPAKPATMVPPQSPVQQVTSVLSHNPNITPEPLRAPAQPNINTQTSTGAPLTDAQQNSQAMNLAWEAANGFKPTSYDNQFDTPLVNINGQMVPNAYYFNNHPAPAGIDPEVYKWIVTNNPQASNIHTGDQQNYTGGVPGQGIVYQTPDGATHLMPNSVPQYGIGVNGVPADQYMPPSSGAASHNPGGGLGPGMETMNPQSPNPAPSTGPVAPGNSGGTPAVQATPGVPGVPPVAAQPDPLGGLAYDPEYAAKQALIAQHRAAAQDYLNQGKHNAQTAAYGRQRQIDQEAALRYKQLLDNYAGRGLAYSGSYGGAYGNAQNDVANQQAGVQQDLTSQLNDLQNYYNQVVTSDQTDKLGAMQQYIANLAQNAGNLGLASGQQAASQFQLNNPNIAAILAQIMGVNR